MDIHIKVAQEPDVPILAKIRAQEWGSEDYWIKRIQGYLAATSNPQQAGKSRTLLVAWEKEEIVGFVAGHLTRRFDCEGELQWIHVLPEKQGKSIATSLWIELRNWFLTQDAQSICVNVEPDNEKGIKFYAKQGAETLDEHWMVWKDIREK